MQNQHSDQDSAMSIQRLVFKRINMLQNRRGPGMELSRMPSAGRGFVCLANLWTVQHLIEKCLIFNMTKEECLEALSKHANIEPVITSTVWNELEKENKEFFEAYVQSKSKSDRMSEEETSQMIQKMIASEGPKDSDDV